jgi:hypothetical protein
MENVMRKKVENLALMREGLGSLGKMAALKKGMLLNSVELQLVTLHLLSQHPSHGYEIIKSVGELTSGVYAPSPGLMPLPRWKAGRSCSALRKMEPNF